MKTFGVFLAGMVLGNAGLYFLFKVLCVWPSAAAVSGSSGPGFLAWPESPWLIAGLIAALVFVAIAALSALAMRSRRIALLAVAWLIERHAATEKRSYRAVWLEKRAVRIWKRVNPGKGARSATGIRKVILAGYGLNPASMPKKVKTVRELPAEVPDLDHWRERRAA